MADREDDKYSGHSNDHATAGSSPSSEVHNPWGHAWEGQKIKKQSVQLRCGGCVTTGNWVYSAGMYTNNGELLDPEEEGCFIGTCNIFALLYQVLTKVLDP